ncbi:MAG: hypothetical protein WBA61_00260 [Aequorivita sp.]
MRIFVLFGFLTIWGTTMLFSQIDNAGSPMKFDLPNSNKESSTGFEMPAIKTPTLSNNKNPNAPINSDLGIEKESNFDMKSGDGLLEYNTNKTPKYFSQDIEAKPEFGKDQYLGDFKTKAKIVTVMYRDHEYVDGDRIRIFVNGEIHISSVTLEGSFRGFNLPLQDGFNKIDFQALNQGTSGPNTAQVQIQDEVGNILASYEWNLLTGNKATAIVVKQ